MFLRHVQQLLSFFQNPAYDPESNPHLIFFTPPPPPVTVKRCGLESRIYGKSRTSCSPTYCRAILSSHYKPVAVLVRCVDCCALWKRCVRVFAFACHVMWLWSALCDVAVSYMLISQKKGVLETYRVYNGVGIECVSII